MKSKLFSLLLLFVYEASFAQATIFEPGIISNNKVFGAALSPNGTEIFFVNAFGGRDTLQIYQSSRKGGKWLTPVPAFFADTSYKQIDPFVSPDGNTILFNANIDSSRNFDVYEVHRTGSGWSKPAAFSSAINSNLSDFYATMSANKNIYFTRRTTSNDIYVSNYVNNQYQPAIPLDSTINSAGSESNPYISAAEDFLIFLSDRKGGFGDSDLYISFKQNNRWSLPLNLGGIVNTSISEFCPSIDLKNGYFYFSRTEVQGKTRVENIYRIKLKEVNIPSLKKQAVFTK